MFTVETPRLDPVSHEGISHTCSLVVLVVLIEFQNLNKQKATSIMTP